MKRLVASLIFIFILWAPCCFADTFRCKSADGTVRYTDRYCGEDTESEVKQSLASVDEAVGRTIRPSKNEFSATTYEDYLIGEARRIGQSILPGQWFVDAKIRHIAYKPPQNGPKVFDRPEPEYKFDNVPGWGVVLHYGPDSNRRVWEIQYQFHHTDTLDNHGDRHGAMLLETISIKKDGEPFTPHTMQNAKRLEMKKTGVWKVRR
jgi:hypothetical protein